MFSDCPYVFACMHMCMGGSLGEGIVQPACS